MEEEVQLDLYRSELEVLDRVFQRACLLANRQVRKDDAERLVRFILEQYRQGNINETTLSACAIWWLHNRFHPTFMQGECIDIWFER
ncbi:hypothetical protein LPJGGPFB_05114 [Ensifer adhaerens]|nr:hypothetical protein [Ensifer adhaerens]